MRRLLLVSAALVAAVSVTAAVSWGAAPRTTTICQKTNSTTRPYQRVVVRGLAALARAQAVAENIIPAPRSCPTTLLTPTTGGVVIEANLAGARERPDVGDIEGTGKATLRLRTGQAQVCYTLASQLITLPAAAAHIHRGGIDEAGPVVVPLGTPDANGAATGCARATRQLVAEILAQRASFYVNIHTSDFPAGAIRGQLQLPTGAMFLKADMNGPAEKPNAGDPDGLGTGMFSFIPDNGRLCYTLSVRNITLPAAAAHIHRGTADIAGPVIIPFTAPNANGAAGGCVTVDAALLREIAANPSGFYANVHTSDFPGGAVRAQLVPA
jgi:hypothetical protein